MNKQARDNRANQLNPNNMAYWKSRMPSNHKHNSKPKTNNQSKKQDSLWKVEYQAYASWSWENRSKVFVDKMKAIDFANSIQTSAYRNVKISKCYL